MRDESGTHRSIDGTGDSSQVYSPHQNAGGTPSQGGKPLGDKLSDNIRSIRAALGDSTDLVVREMKVGRKREWDISFIFIDGLISATLVHYLMDSFVERMEIAVEHYPHPKQIGFDTWIRYVGITTGDVQTFHHVPALLSALIDGKTVILIDGLADGISVCTLGYEHRAVNEPTSQTVIKGPQEAFTETLRVNTALLRRRIKHPDLRLESLELGKVTKTAIAIMYIEHIVDQDVLMELFKRVKQIDIDGVLESNYVEEFIQDGVLNIFPTVNNTERPDTASAALLEGRVIIIIDGSPFVLIVPSLFSEMMQSAEDYYHRNDYGLTRLLRFVSFVATLLTPAVYIALTTFHQEMIPTSLLISLAAQREGVPFPAFVEAMVMEFVFRLLYEAGVRMPRALGTAISIVGALVLGQAAVDADLVSPVMVIIVSVTAITSMIFPNAEIGLSLRTLRFVFMGLAAVFGFYGLFVGIMVLVLYMCNMESFGKPYMSPFAPFHSSDQKDALFRVPIWMMRKRPVSMNTNQYRRPPESNTIPKQSERYKRMKDNR
ncbi:spore germination protein [Paenibacillus sp. UMB4589-SE434]|uniref:spore germination protein n=1 Tax=Paenibacillus sp. UMB4589-SE434 TaxID=3046314 RepID=UPI00254FACCB|nr:spore germination protein [Paenibacillus sp. UMB4589-SE434]MDK8183657.1 spore germination protein [Paenibacillus sp. UMB4589-SE434]